MDDFFFAYQNLSDNNQEYVCFWDNDENKQYASLLGFKILPTVQDLQDHLEEMGPEALSVLSDAHQHRGVYRDDPVILTTFTVHPRGIQFAPLDAADFEEWLDEVEDGDTIAKLISTTFWDIIDP